MIVQSLLDMFLTAALAAIIPVFICWILLTIIENKKVWAKLPSLVKAMLRH